MAREYGFKISWSTVIMLMKTSLILITEFIDKIFEKKQNTFNDSDFLINILLYTNQLLKDWKQF